MGEVIPVQGVINPAINNNILHDLAGITIKISGKFGRGFTLGSWGIFRTE
jgi:hypothetical protein